MSKLEQRFHRLRRIVLALSGANEEVLALVPSERARFESLGWAILITSGVATVSMWFALASAVGINGILALPIALAWGLVIMGIDRWLVVTMPVEGRRKFAIAAPRLALALLLGTLISTPLVLRIFQSEINAQIAKMQQQSYNTFLQQQQASDVAKQVGTYSGELQYLNNVIATHGATTANTASDPEIRGYSEQLTTLDNELSHWAALKSQYYTDYVCQLYGGPTCPKKGFGPAAKDSLQNYNAASQEVDTLKAQINQVQGEIQQRDAQLTSTSKFAEQARYEQALVQQPIVKNEYDTALQRENELQASFFASNQAAHGILIRLEALSELSNGNFTVTAARFLLFLLFLVIECLPVTVKLLQQPGLYEDALGQAREAERRDASKFFSFRSRLPGPNGTAVLRPVLLVEPDYRVDAIWNSTRALPGSVIPEDDRPAEAENDPGPSWTPGGSSSWTPGGSSSWAPGGRADYGPAGSQARSDRPEQRWYGADRWRNHWQEQPAEDDEPPAGATRPGADRMAGAVADPGAAEPRRDYGPTDSAPRAEGWPDHDQEGAYDSDGFRILDYGDESSRTRGSREDAWYDDKAGRTAAGQGPAAVPPGNGGTPLKWDEDA
ncbi:MAG: DUF4407 domain-containing protein [Solirubrobacterales bacterium]|nr:DUF4407 domain-containing protein [Solirubrobacterales bacterium]